jgi:hypothetical protein
MPQGRQKSPGSFRDELGGVIERMGPHDRTDSRKPDKAEIPVKAAAKLEDRLFWRRSDEKA